MEEIKLFVGFIQGIGFTGLLIILAVPKLRVMIFGNGTEELKKYFNHDLTDKLNGMCKKLDTMNTHLDDIRVNGVRLKDK